tara:strand:+ start:958 stop:1206 length:249 start_codon:yes stop_codon:yes gene_type:complete
MDIKFHPSSEAVKEVQDAQNEFLELTISIMLFLCKNGMPLDFVTTLLHDSVEDAHSLYENKVSDDWDIDHTSKESKDKMGFQ